MSKKSHTFKVGSNFPARANKSVVFPEDGGPSKRVILSQIYDQSKLIINLRILICHYLDLVEALYMKYEM